MFEALEMAHLFGVFPDFEDADKWLAVYQANAGVDAKLLRTWLTGKLRTLVVRCHEL